MQQLAAAMLLNQHHPGESNGTVTSASSAQHLAGAVAIAQQQLLAAAMANAEQKVPQPLLHLLSTPSGNTNDFQQQLATLAALSGAGPACVWFEFFKNPWRNY